MSIASAQYDDECRPWPSWPLRLAKPLIGACALDLIMADSLIAMRCLEAVSDEPTADLLTQRIGIHEQTAWMLRALLEE